jgi:hypothetical protein
VAESASTNEEDEVPERKKKKRQASISGARYVGFPWPVMALVYMNSA